MLKYKLATFHNPSYLNSIIKPAGVVELVDTGDLKSPASQIACGFKSRPRHQLFFSALSK
jgi:hypothetical protein